MNILFQTALKAEAQSIISHYNLVKNNTSHIYSNGNVFLFIIGVGNKKVLNRLKSFILNYNQWDTTTIVNIGIAGGNQNDSYQKTDSSQKCFMRKRKISFHLSHL